MKTLANNLLDWWGEWGNTDAADNPAIAALRTILNAAEELVKPYQPVNPITIRGVKENVTIARLWVDTGGSVVKNLSIAVWQPDKALDELTAPPTLVVLDEDQFIEGLQHLFPRGELNH